MSELPGYVWVVAIAGVTGIAVACCAALYAGALAAGRPQRAATLTATAAGALLLAWLLAAAALADGEVFVQGTDDSVPWIGVAIAASLVAWLAATRLPAVSAALADPAAPARLAAVQAIRVVGGVFLVVMALGDLPAVFALPAGLGDVAVGVAAPFVALRLARHPERRGGAVWFNLLGLLDLVVAVSIGFTAAPGPLRLIEGAPSTEPMALLPLALVPTVAVPLAAALHVLSLRRLQAGVAARPNLAPSSPG